MIRIGPNGLYGDRLNIYAKCGIDQNLLSKEGPTFKSGLLQQRMTL